VIGPAPFEGERRLATVDGEELTITVART